MEWPEPIRLWTLRKTLAAHCAVRAAVVEARSPATCSRVVHHFVLEFCNEYILYGINFVPKRDFRKGVSFSYTIGGS